MNGEKKNHNSMQHKLTSRKRSRERYSVQVQPIANLNINNVIAKHFCCDSSESLKLKNKTTAELKKKFCENKKLKLD